MIESVRCPDCGRENPPGAETCRHCGFPLERQTAAPAPAGTQTQGESPLVLPPPRPRRPRRRGTPQTLSLWLVFGSVMALVVLYVGIKANVDRARAPVEGSSRTQQARADSLLDLLEKDSTNVQARVRLGDVLYDTGNWSEAIVHYRAAVRRDSSLATALVDLGVCYYNLGHFDQAEEHFRLALAREPRQPVALYNLGIVHESREDYRTALEYFHRSLNTDPPEAMKQELMEAMTRVQNKAGIQPPPLPPDGS
jgi:tetratricopeptide (TPR) repeat protein